jgi:hypothetical protein
LFHRVATLLIVLFYFIHKTAYIVDFLSRLIDGITRFLALPFAVLF